MEGDVALTAGGIDSEAWVSVVATVDVLVSGRGVEGDASSGGDRRGLEETPRP